MPFLDLLLGVAFLFTGLYVLLRRRNAQGKGLSLPPTRKGWPLIGNLLEIPTRYEWITYHQWSSELNTDILYLNVAGTHILILDTLEAATDLLEKRSSIYSGRMRFPMANELMGWDFFFVGMDYGKDWRQHRRLMDQQLHPTALRQFQPNVRKIIRKMLNNFLHDPESDALEIIRHMIGEIVMSIGYGLEVEPHNDPYISTAKKAMRILSDSAVPGAFLVDFFPLLKHVPGWVPGASFKRKAKEWKKLTLMMVEAPYAAAKTNIDSGVFHPSSTSLNLEKINNGSNVEIYNEKMIKEIAATIYAAGSDTSVGVIGNCILGLILNPDVVMKAQQELDRVLPAGHLPDFNDQDSLPYITAIVKETLRWRDVAPIGVPHKLASDDVYRGYRIPAGCMVVVNQWAILHDEKTYKDPFMFNPDRFMKNGQLDPSVPDPDIACWGFGRRICPGRHLAWNTIWLAIASLLTVFDIKKSVDAEGNTIEPLDETTHGIVNIPMSFKCSITPRSESARELIQSRRG